MARKLRHSALETRTARLKLAVRFKPYSGPTLARGIKLLYRRNQSNGTWTVKASDGHGKYWTKAIGTADDFEDSDGKSVLSFYEAQDRAKQLARRQEGDTTADSRPVTVDEVLTAYAKDLKARGGNVHNATGLRKHLRSVLLSKPLALLTAKELRLWRDGLLDGLQPSSVVRYCKSLRAAFNLAAEQDKRITNSDAWGVGLELLPDSHKARNVILGDRDVSRFVSAAYTLDAALGVYVDVLATCGMRPSQAARLTVEDLHGGVHPKLTVPRSRKGGSKNRAARGHERISVPITPELHAKLRQEAKGRPADAPLLLQADGTIWGGAHDYRDSVAEIVDALKLDAKVTLYALRHSSIVRQLLRGVPVRIIAATHDTSVAEIERTYSKYITDHSDAVSRAALLVHPAETAGNVVPLTR
jgi:integrase